jgi:hypothetical protein
MSIVLRSSRSRLSREIRPAGDLDVQKKTDAAKHPQVLCLVGLHINEPPGIAWLLFS